MVSPLSITDAPLHSLRTGGRVDPLGRPATAPVLSWAVAAEADLDPAVPFTVTCAADPDALGSSATWRAQTTRPWLVCDDTLAARDRRFWRVSAASRTSALLTSPVASFEIGLTDPADWSGRWITAPVPAFPRETWDPCPYLRREFDVDQPTDDVPATVV